MIVEINMVIYFYTIGCEYGDFSNFAAYGVELDGFWWPTVEHYFQAQKFDHNKEYQKLIRDASTPGLAKKLGRSKELPRRADWETTKDSVMLTAVRKKFDIHAKPQKLLLSTGDAVLVESAPNDYYWGAGKDGTGKNRLGTILMQVRTELKLRIDRT